VKKGEWKHVDAGLRVVITPNDKDDLKIPSVAERFEELSREATREANENALTFPEDVNLQLSELIVKSVECTDPEEEKAIDAEIQSLIDKYQNK